MDDFKYLYCSERPYVLAKGTTILSIDQFYNKWKNNKKLRKQIFSLKRMQQNEMQTKNWGDDNANFSSNFSKKKEKYSWEVWNKFWKEEFTWKEVTSRDLLLLKSRIDALEPGFIK
jgi:hypothetical protein